MARIVNHNILDVVSLASILAYLTTGKNPRTLNYNEEEQEQIVFGDDGEQIPF